MKNIVRLMMMTVIMAAFSVATFAQSNQRQRMTREQLAELQARRIAEKLAFDENTSTRFIDTYSRCQKEIWALGPRAGRKQKGKQEEMTDEQTEEAIKERFAQSQKILNIRQKYYGEYSKFLTQKQIQSVYQLEKQMMNRLANRSNKGQMRRHR